MTRCHLVICRLCVVWGVVCLLCGCTQLKAMTLGRSPEYMRNIINPMPSKMANAPAAVYRYYPEYQLYYSEDQGLYFWKKEDGIWERGRSLPFDVVIENPDDYQEVALHCDDPTIFHDSFVRAFPEPGKPVRHTRPEAVASVTSGD